MPPVLTVAVIARDEEATLPGLLGSLADLAPGPRAQLLVLDTGSRDATRSLAASGGAEVHDFAWQDDFSAARNRALELARGDWILCLDADDVLPEETRAWLSLQLDSLDPSLVYAFQVHSPEPGGAASDSSQIRLFPNRSDLRFRNPVHESLGESVWEAGLQVRFSGRTIMHTGYRDPHSVARKLRRNRALLDKALAGAAPSPTLLLSRARMGLAEGDHATAEILLREILSRGALPGRDVALAACINLGQCLCFQGRSREAVALFRAWLPSARSHAQFQLEYGKALWLSGNAEDGRAAWKASLAAGPGESAVPTDWKGVLDGARRLLQETAAAVTWDLLQPEPPDPEVSAGGRGGGGRLDLSICCIFKDEEANLPGLLACLPLDRVECIAVDTGSRDATPSLLAGAGLSPHAFPWGDDFSAARNESLRLATRGWILWLDADDRLEPGFWDALAPLLQGPRQAYRFVVRSPRENSPGDAFRQIRLFPNGLGLGFEGAVHEQLGSSLQRLNLPAAEADLEILHLGYDSAEKRAAKLLRNRALLEGERRAHGGDPAVNMEYGNCLCQSGDYAGARAVYTSLLPSGDPARCGEPPEDEILRHYPALLGETCLQLQDKIAAAAWFRLSCRWCPDQLQPWYWLGKEELAAGRIREALEYFYPSVARPAVVGHVASDNRTVRRNALGIIVLCEMQLFGSGRAPTAPQALREILAVGIADLPFDARVPWELFRGAGMKAEMEAYGRARLEKFPEDLPLWEDYLEHLLDGGRHAEAFQALASRPALLLRTGTLEAFRGKCLESQGKPLEAYAAYLEGLRRFPDDPTLLVYFSECVNVHDLYARCYRDLKALPAASDTLREFMRQMEAQGWGAPEKSRGT